MGVIICIFQGNVSLKVVIGVAVYSLVAYLLKVVSPKEFELLKEMVLISFINSNYQYIAGDTNSYSSSDNQLWLKGIKQKT